MDTINSVLSEISSFVWGPWMAALLLATGLWLTLRMIFIQVRGFAHGVGIASGRYDDPAHKGQLTHFQALTAALSATIGIGNIAGVAYGIYWGGPGALFWMWVTAFFGMAIKYSECSLAVEFRKIETDGNVRGGPMYYIQLGMHRYFKPLAWIFALCTAIAAFGAGNMVQSNTIADSLVDVLEVGRFVVTGDAIKSPDVVERISAYNQSLAETEAGLAQRKAMKTTLDQASESYGAESVEALRIRREMDAQVAPLQETKDVTQAHRDWLTSLALYTVERGDNVIEFYTESDLPSADITSAYISRLNFGNDPIDLANVNVVRETPVHTWRWVIGIVLASLAAIVLIGGIKRIGNVASYLVPFMSVVYCLSALVILILKYDQILPAFQLIFYHAFNPTAVVGGSVSGATLWLTFSWGLKRGLFSNEAGQGSAAMAHSTAKVEEPVREGLVAMLGPFIDTIVICTMTGLVIISTGVWDCGVNGAPLTMKAFDSALPFYGKWMVVVGVALFAFSTILAWSYYGEKGAEYVAGKGFKMPYKWIYVIFTLVGARFKIDMVWSYADAANGLMAVPNLIALIVLSGVVVKYTRKYMGEKKQGLHRPYKRRLSIYGRDHN